MFMAALQVLSESKRELKAQERDRVEATRAIDRLTCFLSMPDDWEHYSAESVMGVREAAWSERERLRSALSSPDPLVLKRIFRRREV